jgi:hypothetical protein
MADLPTPGVKKQRADGQISGLAGEFFVAGELLKRGMQTSLTLGNAKAVDLFARNAAGRLIGVQVKALRSKNYFPIDSTRIAEDCIYVFVILNKPGEALEFFIVPGSDLASTPDKFGRGFQDKKFPCIHPKQLEEYRDKWALFE